MPNKYFVTPYEASRLLGYKNQEQFYKKRSKSWYKKLNIREKMVNSREFYVNKSDLIKNKVEILRYHKEEKWSAAKELRSSSHLPRPKIL